MSVPEDALRRRLDSERSPLAILRAAAREASCPALVWLRSVDDPSPVEWSYDELLSRVEAAMATLRAHGIQPDDAVGLLAPATPEAVAYLIAATAVATAFPLNTMLAADGMAAQFSLGRVRVVVEHVGDTTSDLHRRVLEAAERASCLTSILPIGQALDGGDSCAREPLAVDALPADGARIAALFHTGGTTGDPKLAQLSISNLAAGAHMAAAAVGYRAGDRLLMALPLFHVGGAIDAVLAGLAARATVILPPPLGARDGAFMGGIWMVAERLAANLIMMVPTSLSVIAAQPVGDAKLGALRGFITGASPLPPPVAARLQEMTGKPVSQLFGMTEASGICTSQPCDGVLRSHAVGYPAPLLRMRLGENPDQDPGAPAEVFYAGPNVFQGYRTVDGTVGLPENGWVASGDLGVMDADGQLRLLGRSKDVIIRGGHNIDPLEIEAAAQSHPAVALAAAVGMPDAHAGELPVLYVTLRAGHDVTPEDVGAFVSARISDPPARPKRVFVIDALPLTAVGKIERYRLRQKAAEFRAAQLLEGLPVVSVRCLDKTAKRLEISWSAGAGPMQREDGARRLADLGLAVSDPAALPLSL